MTNNDIPAYRTKKKVHIHTWHRRAGLIAACFALILAFSGLLLNHSTYLGLDKRQLESDMLISLYGSKSLTRQLYFRAGEDIVSQIGDQLLINNEQLWLNRQSILGATSNRKYITLAFSNELATFTHDGELLERITYLPQPITAIEKIGRDTEGRVALFSEGIVLVADLDMISWDPVKKDTSITWSKPITASDVSKQPPETDLLYPELTWERLLLDIHSGRILGSWGPYLMDIMALAMVFLVFTGLWRWWKLQKIARTN